MNPRAVRGIPARPPCLLLAVAWLALATVGAMIAAPGAATAAPGRLSSLRNSPGYTPPVDPESMSVVVGRRLNAPRVSRRFQGGAPNLDALGRSVCRALRHGATDSLLSLCITDEEFRDVLWREFPQSRPAVGLTWVDAWRILYARLHAGSAHAARDYGGRAYEFLRFEAGEPPKRYRNFTLHNRLALVARDDRGEVVRMKWMRSVAERRGRFKIYSTED